MTPRPSLATLRRLFHDKAADARAILTATRYADVLAISEAARKHEDNCYASPALCELRMEALAALDSGFYGVESFHLTKGRMAGQWITYLNAGDAYTETLLYINGHYRVGCWGDYAEKYT